MTVVWGYGSIGRRHVMNLLAIDRGPIGLITRSPQRISISHTDKIVVWTPDQVKWDQVDQLIIATPTSYHLEHLSLAITQGVKKILLEKPVSHSTSQIGDLTALINKTGTSVFVGYDLRYDEGIKQTERILSSNKLGRICSIHAHAGQFLPDWRPSENYARSMSALISQGGGVMLDLAHEIDYLVLLFGEISALASSNHKRSDLEIETEDTCDTLFWFRDGFSGTLHLDYLQRPLRRFLDVVGDKGRLHVNLAEKIIELTCYENQSINRLDYQYQKRDDRFRECLLDFTSNQPSRRLCDWQQGCASLKIIAESKISETYRQTRSGNIQ